MNRLLAGLLGFLLIASVGSHAARAPEQYWKSALPNTPMPSSLSQLLSAPAGGTSVNVGSGGVHVDAAHGKPGGTTVDVGKGGVGVNVKPGSGKPSGTTVGVGKAGVDVNVKPGYGKPGGTTVGVGKGGVGVNVKPGYGKPGGTTVGVGKGGVGVHVKPRRGKPVNVNVMPFVYSYAATDTQVHDDPSSALFFQEKDLHAGKKLDVHFIATAGAGEKFLPRSEADAIPFSSEKVPEILSRFSVEPDSAEAAEMAQTLRDCEATAAKGERKLCATSLESMVDFATSSLGTSRVRAASTVVGKKGSPKQEYTMTGVKSAAGATDQLVACHAEPYAYAVFACHLTRATRAYTVSMVGRDGTAVEAVAVCHADTAGWNPKHVAFQVLKVKPGTVPVCHFLPQDHVVWTRSG
ncbi:hypothetical protein QYE76_055416 [Lolium multiflorum]|uniref:BURP domain-containing protein n=1 Tax=Lolium multiflorum TaxID=4521 RepID=A0AAD8SZP6_LOLMU|nr:hypothetical protein QYE76_055401 [Lolium multiflorum]KAK1667257.1 hypothetical protein QYE76_055416 [Lolium multiflorum]